MGRPHLAVAVVCALALGPMLGGCVGPDRGINGTVDDITIGTQVSIALVSPGGTPNVTVYRGRVLLTGSTPSLQSKADAEAAARGVAGVRMVYNELVAGPPEGANEYASDAWITAEVRSQLLLAVDVRSSNYLVATDRSIVYLMGTAASQAELDRAIQIARYVVGVRRVVSYVDIGGSMPSAAEPAPPPYPTGAVPPTAAPSPNAPIQVQKL